jgi:hypothetical protein
VIRALSSRVSYGCAASPIERSRATPPPATKVTPADPPTNGGVISPRSRQWTCWDAIPNGHRGQSTFGASRISPSVTGPGQYVASAEGWRHYPPPKSRLWWTVTGPARRCTNWPTGSRSTAPRFLSTSVGNRFRCVAKPESQTGHSGHTEERGCDHCFVDHRITVSLGQISIALDPNATSRASLLKRWI